MARLPSTRLRFPYVALALTLAFIPLTTAVPPPHRLIAEYEHHNPALLHHLSLRQAGDFEFGAFAPPPNIQWKVELANSLRKIGELLQDFVVWLDIGGTSGDGGSDGKPETSTTIQIPVVPVEGGGKSWSPGQESTIFADASTTGSAGGTESTITSAVGGAWPFSLPWNATHGNGTGMTTATGETRPYVGSLIFVPQKTATRTGESSAAEESVASVKTNSSTSSEEPTTTILTTSTSTETILVTTKIINAIPLSTMATLTRTPIALTLDGDPGWNGWNTSSSSGNLPAFATPTNSNGSAAGNGNGTFIMTMPTAPASDGAFGAGISVLPNGAAIGGSGILLPPPVTIPDPSDLLPMYSSTISPGSSEDLVTFWPSLFPPSTPDIDTDRGRSALLQLTNLCTTPSSRVKTIALPLLDRFFGPQAYPSLKWFPGCKEANPSQALRAPGLLNCTELGTVVQTCQARGKKMILVVRGSGGGEVGGDLNYGDSARAIRGSGPLGGTAGSNTDGDIWHEGSVGPFGPYFPLSISTDTDLNERGHHHRPQKPLPNLFTAVPPIRSPSSLALTLYSLFGNGKTERADLRPLGPDIPHPSSTSTGSESEKVGAGTDGGIGVKFLYRPLGEEVVLDGFDVQVPVEWKGLWQGGQFEGLVRELGALEKEDVKEEGDGHVKVVAGVARKWRKGVVTMAWV